MSQEPAKNAARRQTTPRNRTLRLSTMRLLAAGAIMTAGTAHAQVDVATVADLTNGLNTAEDISFLNDLNLGGSNFNVTIRTQFFGTGGTRTISNGSVTVLGSSSETSFVLFNLTPGVIFDGDVILPDFARLDLDAPTVLGASGTVDAEENTDIRLFTGAGDTNTWDADLFAKISGIDDSTAFSITGDGTGILTALPTTFDAIFNLNIYNDFEDFAVDPAVDPTLQLGATLAGNHNVFINAGTLDLNDFDFTIDSLEGVAGTEITLGSGTLTTGDAQNKEYAGVISGTGNLIKTGSGVFTLSGINTYSGTTTVTDGTLVLEADQTGPTAVAIQNGATMRVNADQTGAPTYDVQVGGVLDLFADLVDTTVITVDGTMNLNNIDQTLGTIDGGGLIALGNADFTVGDATDSTFSGMITGSSQGSLTKNGAGNLTLGGMNTYAGPTSINEGTLTLDGDLNDGTSVTVAAGATLDLNDDDETLAGLFGSGDVLLGTGTLTINGGNSFGGTISETGNFVKNGTGTMTFSSAQTYTGTTTINGGILNANADFATSSVTVNTGATFNLAANLPNASVTVSDGAVFFGDGTIGNNLTNNGTLSFTGQGEGNTLNVGGNYTQGATGVLNVSLGAPVALVITGNGSLGGTLNLGLPVDAGNFDITSTYNVVTAGSLGGSFATVNDEFAFLDTTVNNVGGNVQVSFARNAVPLTAVALTPNQTTIATVLDGIGAPAAELESAINRVVASSEDGARLTFDQLAGAGAATASTQTAFNAVQQSHRVLDQAVGILPGSTRPRGAFSQAPTDNFDDTDHYTLISFYQGAFDEAFEEEDDSDAVTIAGMTPTPWGAFYGGFGDQGDGGESVDYTRFGLLIGLELESAEREATYGLSIGVEQSEFDFSRDNGGVDITSIYLTGYTHQPLGDTGFNFTVGGSFGFHSHDSSRDILIGATPTPANADFDSYSLTLAAELSKTFDITYEPLDPGGHPTQTSIEPFVRFDYSISDQDGYTETGAGAAGLVVGATDYDSSYLAAGVRVQHQYMLFEQYEATLQGRASINAALENSDSGFNVSFVGNPGTNFNIEGSDQDDVFGLVGAGLSVEINENWDMHFDADLQFGSDAFGALFMAGLSYNF